MDNRLRELREKKKYTLDDIAAKTGINRGTYNNYESGKTEPKPETWQALANFFNVSVEYLKGAYSKEEIASIAQKEYKRQYDTQKKAMFHIAVSKLRFLTVDDYFISIGVVPYDVKQESFLLSEQQVNDTNFWRSHLEPIYEKISVKWLLEKPTLNANKDDVLSAVNSAMDSIINESSIALTNPWLNRKYDEISDNSYFAKRLKFLQSHTFYDEETYEVDGHEHVESVPYFNWNKTND